MTDPLALKKASSNEALASRGLHLDDEHWKSKQVEIMKFAMQKRWHLDHKFRKLLRDSGAKALLHYSRNENSFWAGQFSPKDSTWTGNNMCGKLLMELRDKMSNEMPQIMTKKKSRTLNQLDDSDDAAGSLDDIDD